MTQTFLLTEKPNKLTRSEASAACAQALREVERMTFAADKLTKPKPKKTNEQAK